MRAPRWAPAALRTASTNVTPAANAPVSESHRQHLNRHGHDVGLSPGCRDAYGTEWRLQRLREDVADNRNHASLAIQDRRARGTVIKDKTVVSVVHLKQRRTCDPVAISVSHEATGGETQTIARISQTDNALFCGYWLHPDLQSLCTGICCSATRARISSRCGSRRAKDADVNRLSLSPPSRISTCFQSCVRKRAWPRRRAPR